MVLAAHLLPLGPKGLGLNEAAGLMGMALFFALSGFLIVQFLANGTAVSAFVIRRLARILPLAWLAMIVLFLAFGGPLTRNLFFVANIPTIQLLNGGAHLWSLCVEMQFYLLAAALGLFPTRKVLLIVPVLCLSVTSLRVLNDVPISIVTWYRVDEILAGGTVALIHVGWLGSKPRAFLKNTPLSLAAAALFLCSFVEPLMFFRPYAGAIVLGAAIYNLKPWEERLLVNRPMAYIAEVSYALYVIHGALTVTWLASGETIEKYLKRPLLFAVTFGLAHASTFYMEKPISRLARSLERKEAAVHA